MFKFIQDNKIKEVREEDTFNRAFYVGEIIEDTEHTVADYMQVNGEYVLTSSVEAIEQKKADVRAVRNQYLEQTDKYLSVTDFPITDDERELYRQYREYLRTYPETEGWYENPPKDFSTWKEMLTEEE